MSPYAGPEILKYRKGHVVRSVGFEAKMWFLALDVCEILGLTDTSKSVKRLHTSDKQKFKVHLSGIRRIAWFLSESGVYQLVATSTKPEAKKFKEWMRDQVAANQAPKIITKLGRD